MALCKYLKKIDAKVVLDFMPPPPTHTHFEKLEGHIAFDSSVCLSATIFRMDIVTFEPLQPDFWNLIYGYLIRK